MKKLFLSVFVLFTFSVAGSFAQSVDQEITLIQEAFGKDKRALVQAYMNLSPEKAAAF